VGVKRIEHAAIAIVLLVAFVADLRFMVPVVLVVLAAWAVRHVGDRTLAAIGAGALGIASLSFLAGNEIAAWAVVLAVAVLAGVSAFGPARQTSNLP
jgi:hypothetical protein